MREDRQVQLLYFLTDILIYWIALSVVVFSRVNTIYQIDFVMIQRDRLVCVLIFALASLVAGVYRPSSISDRFDAVYLTVVALGVTLVAEFALAALLPVDLRVVSRRELLLGNLVAGVFLGVWHYAAARLASRFASLRRYFYVLGNEEEGKRIVGEIKKSGVMAADARYATLDGLKKAVEQRNNTQWNADTSPNEEVVIALAGEERDRLPELLGFCEQHFRRTYLYPSLNDMLLFHHSGLLAVGGVPLIEVASKQLATPYLYLKRAMDFVIAAIGLVATLPLGLATAIAVKASSPGGIFYLQERMGKNGRPFKIIKFRSMLAANPGNAPPKRAPEENGRITGVGKIIRKFKIDELPQLINVLKGDMSLIGPRPLWDAFPRQHGEESPLWERRLAVRPGLTSLSHVLGNSFAKPGDFLRYDLVYISSLSLLVDLKILFKTVRAVLSGRGAE